MSEKSGRLFNKDRPVGPFLFPFLSLFFPLVDYLRRFLPFLFFTSTAFFTSMGLGGFFGRHADNVQHRCTQPTTTTAAAAMVNQVDAISSARSSSSNQSAHTSSVRSPSNSAVYTPQKPRFEQHADGTHTHCIRCMPTSKLSASLQNMASLLPSTKSFKIPLMGGSGNSEKKALEAIQKEREAINNELHRTPSDTTYLSDKWGTCHEVIGKGAFGVVRIVHKADPSGTGKGSCGKLYAVKV